MSDAMAVALLAVGMLPALTWLAYQGGRATGYRSGFVAGLAWSYCALQDRIKGAKDEAKPAAADPADWWKGEGT